MSTKELKRKANENIDECKLRKAKIETSFGPAIKINATEIARPYREEVKTLIKEKFNKNPPKLVGLLANDDKAARSYAGRRVRESEGVRKRRR